MIAGVAGGLAEYLELDVTLLRLLMVLSVSFGGIGIPACIVSAIVPREKTQVKIVPYCGQWRGEGHKYFNNSEKIGESWEKGGEGLPELLG
jgi:phage shock protein PspC (stress-responsive transcriptional regulator)